jgi:hypothetical protein
MAIGAVPGIAYDVWIEEGLTVTVFEKHVGS